MSQFSLSRTQGSTLDDEISSIQQSIADILTTTVGSRVMRREYGSLLMDLIDQPTNDMLLLKIYSAVYTALFTWEKRIHIEHIAVQNLAQGTLQLILQATLAFTGQKMNLNIPLRMGAVL